jgi:hypothetical protein
MGNWSYLAANRTSNPNYFLDWMSAHEDIQIIMAAKYALPPLWHGIFQESDLHTCVLTLDDGESSSHPIYSTPAQIGIQRAIQGRSRFCSLFPENIELIYDKWLELLKLFNGYYIHMDWSDIAAMGNEDEVKQINLEVQAGIRAFQSNEAIDWNACFRTSSAAFDEVTRQVILNSYTKNSTGAVEGDLYGYHYVKRKNKRGGIEWKVEFESDS